MDNPKARLTCEITSVHKEVTGSCNFAHINYPNGRKTNGVVDCGLFQEKAYNVLNNMPLPFRGEIVDFALVTHNHADHMARLPHLVRDGFQGNIYASTETARFMPVALRDSFKIMKENNKKKGQKNPYDEEDLMLTIENIKACEFGQVEYLDKNVKATFFMNGHLPGASIILVQISYPNEEDINLVFTGDYKPNNKFFIVKDMPDWVYDLPVTVVTESTYGYMDTHEVEYHMEKDLEEYIKAGYTVIISGFAQQRIQETEFMLKVMQDQNRISCSIPIRQDGNLGQEYTRMFATSKLLIDNNTEDFLPQNFSFVTKENREEILNYQGQQIVITTSGMVDHGPAQIYLERYIENGKVLIYIPGYTSPDTIGFKLQHPVDGKVVINGKERNVRAKVISTHECSSHAKADEIIDFLQKFRNLNLVLINHGQKNVMEQFAERVKREVDTKRVEVLGEHTFRISHYGYVKHWGSKWIVPDITKKERERAAFLRKAKKSKGKPDKKRSMRSCTKKGNMHH